MSKTYKFKPFVGAVVRYASGNGTYEVIKCHADGYFDYRSNVTGNTHEVVGPDSFAEQGEVLLNDKQYLINKFIEICGNTYTQK